MFERNVLLREYEHEKHHLSRALEEPTQRISMDISGAWGGGKGGSIGEEEEEEAKISE